MLAKAKPQELTQVGDYDLLERLGEGAMGTVYRGRHRPTGLIVAIKIVHEDVAKDTLLLKRFEREFQTARRLNHPNMVHSLELDLKARPPYLVMEFVDGANLSDIIESQGALPESQAVALITQVAEALQQAHENGIFHRDVKPDNILVTTDGQAKLTDLGVAKDLHNDQDLTSMGKGLGTPHFMAPEQLLNAKNVDARCDVYALGATLYTMVTGVIPFHTDEPLITVFKRKARNQYTPPRKLLPTISERMAQAIDRAMQAEAGQRYGSCIEFIEALTGQPFPRKSKEESRPVALPRAEAVLVKPPPGERRAAIRYASKAHGKCQSVGGEKYPRWRAYVRDVSAVGIGLLLNRRFEPGATLIVELQGKARPRHLLVRVVRMTKHASREWLLGCSFLSRLNEDAVNELCKSM
jgi:serine/threonine protein kinase